MLFIKTIGLPAQISSDGIDLLTTEPAPIMLLFQLLLPLILCNELQRKHYLLL